MKPISRRPILIVTFSLLLVMAITIVRSRIALPPILHIPPAPPNWPVDMPTNGNTPTPNATDISIYSTTNAQFPHPTPTALVISKITDLSPDLPEDDKYAVVVAHPDGTNEKFTIGPISFQTNTGHPNMVGTITPDIITRLNLKPGDTILSSYSIKEMKTIILAPTSIPTISIAASPEITIGPTQTNLPYAIPSTQGPYP